LALAKDILLEELADATLDGTRKEHVELLTSVPLLMRRRHRASFPTAEGGGVKSFS
jgi:hypothetical protein